MKKEFPLEEEWLPYELRPNTPPEGIPILELFPGIDVQQRYMDLNKAGEPYGIKFGTVTKVSNSRLALEAAEYARDKGRFASFHERIFYAYFTENQDIGNLNVLIALAREQHLDPHGLAQALRNGIYTEKIRESMSQAAKYGINAIPTFILNNQEKIVGAQALSVFRQKLLQILAD